MQVRFKMAPKSNFETLSKNKVSAKSITTLIWILTLSLVHGKESIGCFSPDCIHFQKRNYTNPVNVFLSDNSKEKVTTFCYDGLQKSVLYLWANPGLRVTQRDMTLPDISKFLTFYGESKSDADFRRGQPGYALLQNWAASLRTLRQTEDFSLNPFNLSCIAIETNIDYTARISIKAIDLWYITYLVAGVVIFFSAKTWSQNTTLHYGTGVSVGVLASLVILVFVLAKVLPSRLKNIGYVLMFMGTSMAFWLLSTVTRVFSDNVIDNLVGYWQYVVAYCVATGLMSFAVVYRYGPVTNERTLKLIQWLLQIIGLILIYNSTQIREVSIALVLITFTVYNFPRALLFNKTSRTYWKRAKKFSCYKNRFFPPKIKLLSEDEYINQGNQETKKALEQLREYCRSPDCQSWRIISRLKSPQRFADFVEGNSWHVSNEELLEYDSETELLPPHELQQDMNIEDEDNESEMDFILSSP